MREHSPPFETPVLAREEDPLRAGPEKANQPTLLLVHEGDTTQCVLEGCWDVRHAVRAAHLLQLAPQTREVVFVLDDVARLDSAGAQLLAREAQRLRALGHSVDYEGDEARLDLVQRVARLDPGPAPAPARATPILRTLNDLGASIVEEARITRDLFGFFGMFLVTLVATLLRPWRFRIISLAHHMEHTGVHAVPIVALLSFLIGLVTAYMGAQQFARFGAQIFAINLIEVTILREMGVVLTSLVVAGRSGSSFTAQIGAMMANEEVAAMRTMGLDPMVVLVIPRVVALVCMLPMLTFVADFMGVLGGMLATWMTLGIDPEAFVARFREITSLRNFMVGLTKAPFFALAIALVGCFQGFRVTGSAESVGRLTTQAVVEAIFLVIVLNAFFAILFSNLGV